MNNTLTPAIGSNQFLTKFDAKAKRKFKLRIKFATKVKLFIVFLLIFSLYANYYLLKTNYVFTCRAVFDGVEQNWKLGHLMNKNTCNDLIDDRIRNLAQIPE